MARADRLASLSCPGKDSETSDFKALSALSGDSYEGKIGSLLERILALEEGIGTCASLCAGFDDRVSKLAEGAEEMAGCPPIMADTSGLNQLSDIVHDLADGHQTDAFLNALHAACPLQATPETPEEYGRGVQAIRQALEHC